LVGRGARRRLKQPWIREGCAAGSGVCKCAAARDEGAGRRTLVFVGDGRSDFCVSALADILFAKGALAAYAADRGQAFIPFETFDDVTAALSRLVADRPAPEAAVAL
jgi:2-hydroxy-3-keto-5-methylthiopentenyl-1-phosphate phosphatase